MEKDVIFKGAGVAIATPFYENGNGINYDELARLIDFNLNNGTDAIIIAGTSGAMEKCVYGKICYNDR